LEFLRNIKFLARVIVIESLHAVDHQALVKALQREIFPRRTAIVRMRYGRLVVIVEIFSRNEDDKNSCVFCPCFVGVDEQIEESLPMFGVATRIKSAPLLRVER